MDDVQTSCTKVRLTLVPTAYSYTKQPLHVIDCTKKANQMQNTYPTRQRVSQIATRVEMTSTTMPQWERVSKLENKTVPNQPQADLVEYE